MEVVLTQILDSVAAGVLAVDLENRILYFNRSLAKRLNLRLEEWRGRHFRDLVDVIEPLMPPSHDFASRLEWVKEPEARRNSQELELRNAGQPQIFREDSRALRDASGRVIGRVFTFHDISREKEIDRMKTEFIAVASHELRTPMTSIKGSIDLILSGFAGEISSDTQELLEIAHKSCDRLIRLINDILDLAKIEAGQMQLKLARMDITEAVERCISGVRSFAEQSGVSLSLERDERLPPVQIDRDRMEQAVTNLLSNAIKFSPANGQVRVLLSACDGWVQCCVVDQGCGIHENDLPKIFGKFQQVGEKRRTGTGLGLAITQALVQEHGGEIWVESKVNEGSKFAFKLPGAEEDAAQAVGTGAAGQSA
jgi:PAS domain S-box-containing protein